MRSVCDAPSIAARIGLAESSGRTISEWAMRCSTPVSWIGGNTSEAAGGSRPDPVQTGIDAAEREQIRRGSPCSATTAVMEHDDRVGVANRVKPMRDHDDGPALHQTVETLHDQLLRFACRATRWARRGSGSARRG